MFNVAVNQALKCGRLFYKTSTYTAIEMERKHKDYGDLDLKRKVAPALEDLDVRFDQFICIVV